MNNDCEHRPLDNIDVREEETLADTNAVLRIEFATFAEGEYVESILIDQVRAKEIHVDLGKLLGIEPRFTPAESTDCFSPRETATMVAALRYWQREGLLSAGGEHNIVVDGGRAFALSTQEINKLIEKINLSASLVNSRSSDMTS